MDENTQSEVFTSNPHPELCWGTDMEFDFGLGLSQAQTQHLCVFIRTELRWVELKLSGACLCKDVRGRHSSRQGQPTCSAGKLCFCYTIDVTSSACWITSHMPGCARLFPVQNDDKFFFWDAYNLLFPKQALIVW